MFFRENLSLVFICLLSVIGISFILFAYKTREKEQKKDKVSVKRVDNVKIRAKSEYKEAASASEVLIKAAPVNTNELTIADNVVSSTEVEKSVYDLAKIQEKVIYFLSRTEPEGASFKRIKAYSWSCIKDCYNSFNDYEEVFKCLLNDLQKQQILKYDVKKKIWKCCFSNIDAGLEEITAAEKRYFKVKNWGAGWYRLTDKSSGLGAIRWIYKNFTSDDFEKFCCAILSHHNVKDVKVSEKRNSGADGGIDGLGIYELEGAFVNVTFQAKKYKPENYIQHQEMRDFIGALIEKDIDYGIFITTGVFSENAIKCAEEATSNDRNNVHLDLIDKNKLVECMEYRGDSAHGYGLHKTDDKGWYYLNPNMLKTEISKF